MSLSFLRRIQSPARVLISAQPQGVKTFCLSSQPYLDTYNQCYKNIVVTNLPPQGPLGAFVRKTNFPPLSEFKAHGPCSREKNCGLALSSLEETGCCGKQGSCLMTVDEVPNLITFLAMNGYAVDTSITKMFNTSDVRFQTTNSNKLICFVTYLGNPDNV